MKKVILFLLSASIAFGQAGRPPVDHYSQLLDVDVTGLVTTNIMTWNGTKWVPGSASSIGLPSIAGHGGQFLGTDATSIFWGQVPFSSLSSKPTTAAGYGITNGSNIDGWGTKTPFAGTLTIASGKTVAFANTVSFSGTDGATLNIGGGGTLGSNAFNSIAFVLQTTQVNGHALSSNVTVTKTDLGLGYLLSGAGSPEGAITAPIGSQYARTDGGSGTSFYVKQSGTGNTGWTAATLGVGNVPTGGTVGQALIKNSSTDFDMNWAPIPGGSGGGTVLDVSVTTANGVSGTVATASTHPAITLTLGAITPSSVASTGAVSGTNLSGTNTGDQTITLTGPVTGSGTGSFGTAITDGAVALVKIAPIAANTILGNNTGGIASPIALTSTQTKTLLSLNNVENTALSTWAGSTNITTVGNLTGSSPTSSVAYSLLPVGTTTSTVAAGNDSRFPASVTGIRKSSGAGSTDVAASINTDFGLPSEGGFTNNGTTTTPLIWGAGKTVMSEGTNLPLDRYSTLPAAASFAPGTIITYIDNKTTGDFGRNFRPLTSPADTLDGLNAAGWAAANAWLRPFIAGGLNVGQGVYQWKTDGSSAWVSIYADGRATKVQDPLVSGKQAFFSVSSFDPAGQQQQVNISPLGDSVTVVPSQSGNAVGPGGGTVPNPGVAAIGVTGSGGIVYGQLLPDPSTGGLENQILKVVGGVWTAAPVSVGTLSVMPWSPVGPSGGVVTLACDNSRIEQHHIVSLTADSTLAFQSTTNGMMGRVKIRQGGTPHTLALPNNVKTPSNGAGVLILTGTANSEDEFIWDYDGTNFNMYPAGLNFTGQAAVVFNTPSDDLTTGLATSGFAIQGSSTGTKYWASQFTACGNTSGCLTAGTTYQVGKAVLRLKKLGTPTYNIWVELHTNVNNPTTLVDEPVSTANGGLVGSASLTLPATDSSITTAEGDVTFNNLAATLTAGTKYWVVLLADNTTTSGTNNIQWANHNGTGLGPVNQYSATTGLWTQNSNARTLRYILYKP